MEDQDIHGPDELQKILVNKLDEKDLRTLYVAYKEHTQHLTEMVRLAYQEKVNK